MTLMSPRMTFQSCGSSSTLSRRRIRPARVMRASPLSTAKPAQAVERRELLALFARARGVPDRHLVDANPPAEQARGDLRLDREAALAQAEGAEDLRGHRLLAGHHVGDPAVVEQVRRERDG